MTNLSQKALEALKPGDIGSRLVDGGGLTGKVRERRVKIIVQFEYRYRSKDKIRQIVCGTWPDKSLKAIREKRDEYRTSVNNGDDPLDILKYPELVKSLTSDDIKKAAETYLKRDRYVKVVMMPEKK